MPTLEELMSQLKKTTEALDKAVKLNKKYEELVESLLETNKMQALVIAVHEKPVHLN